VNRKVHDHNNARWLDIRFLPAIRRGCVGMQYAGWFVVRTCKCHPGLPVTLPLATKEHAEHARRAMLATSEALGT